MATSPQTKSPSMLAFDDDSDNFQVELVDIAIRHLLEVTGSQWVNFLEKELCDKLDQRTFSRFIVGDGPWTFGEWRFGDDINLIFLTMDNENRWGEVVTEALGVEVGSKDLKEATKDGTLDLTDERLCHFRDGRRTQYWFLKHANDAKCRIKLHYCRISPDWLGPANITTVLRDTIVPDWPENLPKKSYTANLAKIQRLQKTSHKSSHVCMRKIYPLARTWAEVNDLWTAGPVTAALLFHTISSLSLAGRFDPESEGEMMFMAVLECLASEDEFPAHVPEACRAALFAAAEEALKDREVTMATIRAAQTSLAPSQPKEQPVSPTAQKPAPRSSFALGSRFRDARGAISRLRFDVSHAGIEYDIGYLDRFEGMRWMTLSKWGGKSTEDEDFIPEHRVKQIVRVKDGVVVWDREKKIDRTSEV